MRERQQPIHGHAARLFLVLVLVLTATIARPSRAAGAVMPVYFPQTGHMLGPHFTLYWRERGGLRAFGYPLSEEFVEDGRMTQYFERAVMQYFPENAGSPWAVQLIHLGRALLAGREEEAPLQSVDPATVAPDRAYFPETSHTLGGTFGRFWQAGGGLAVYGYPLSEEFVEVSPSNGRPYLVQYFERNRFEHHPEHAGTPYEVLLGLLGSQRASGNGLFGAPAFAPVPAPPTVARTLTRVETDQPLIALTFDGGADRGFAPQILDILAANGVKASFGITGQWARANPDLVARIGSEGHHVINHTDDHRSFTGLSDQRGGQSAVERIAQLERADAIIAPLLGRSTRPWFRPPYGDYDAAALEQIAAAGYWHNVMWTVDTLGWNGLSAAAIVDRALQAAVPGGIVLMHVGAGSQDAAALQPMIDALRARGYDFATVEQLVSR